MMPDHANMACADEDTVVETNTPNHKQCIDLATKSKSVTMVSRIEHIAGHWQKAKKRVSQMVLRSQSMPAGSTTVGAGELEEEAYPCKEYVRSRTEGKIGTNVAKNSARKGRDTLKSLHDHEEAGAVLTATPPPKHAVRSHWRTSASSVSPGVSPGSRRSTSPTKQPQPRKLDLWRRSTKNAQVEFSHDGFKNDTAPLAAALNVLDCGAHSSCSDKYQLSNGTATQTAEPELILKSTCAAQVDPSTSGSTEVLGFRHSIEDPSPCPSPACADRRTALVFGLDFVPYFEHDPTFSNFASILRSEAHHLQRTELDRARVHYQNILERHPSNHVVLVNLACCYSLLGKHADALPLLARAVQRNPVRPSAYLNQVLCLLHLHKHNAALALIERIFSSPVGVSKGQRSLLLRCKAAILMRAQDAAFALTDVPNSQQCMQLCCEMAAAAAREDPLEAPHETQRGKNCVVNPLVAEACQIEKLPDCIAPSMNCSDQNLQGPAPSRTNDFGCDETPRDSAGSQKLQTWRSLHPDQVRTLQEQLQSISTPQSINARKRGEAAYKTVKMLSFFKCLEPQQAVEMLEFADLVEIEPRTYVFHAGDPVEFMYVIAMGSVRIKGIQKDYGPYPVTLNTCFDGEHFGEKPSPRTNSEKPLVHQTSAVAQEQCWIIRFCPVSWQRVIDAVFREETTGKDSSCGSGMNKDADILSLSDVTEGRMRGLRNVPCFRHCSDHHLMRLANNSQELSFRYGEAVVRVGDQPRECFILLDGFCRASVSLMPDESHPSALSQLSQPIACNEDGKHELHVHGNRHQRKTIFVEERHRETHVCPFGGTVMHSQRRCSMALVPRHNSVKESSDLSDLGTTGGSTDLPIEKARASQFRASQAQAFSNKPHTVIEGPVPSEIDICVLLPGNAFGYGAFCKSHECPFVASATVRVDSAQARLLALTQRSLQYLPSKVAASVVEQCRRMADAAQPSTEVIRRKRKRHSDWVAFKRKVVMQHIRPTL